MAKECPNQKAKNLKKPVVHAAITEDEMSETTSESSTSEEDDQELSEVESERESDDLSTSDLAINAALAKGHDDMPEDDETSLFTEEYITCATIADEYEDSNEPRTLPDLDGYLSRESHQSDSGAEEDAFGEFLAPYGLSPTDDAPMEYDLDSVRIICPEDKRAL
jgi:hypothetical protein